LSATTWIFYVQLFRIASVCMQMGGKNSRLAIGLQDHSSSAISKNHRNCTPSIAQVHGRRLYFSTYHQYGLVHTCFDKLVCHRNAINESRTRIPDVQSANAFQS